MLKVEHFKKHLSHTNNFIENNQGIRFIRHIFRFLGLVILIATGIQISYQLSDRKKEIKVREASHRHLLRENLYSQIPGSSGKGEALQELMMIEGDGLQGLDLSCERMKGGWYASTHTCKNPVTLYGLDFEEIYNISQKEAEKAQLSSGVAEYGINFNRLNFSGVNAQSQVLSHLSSEGANLIGAQLSWSTLRNVYFDGDFTNLHCRKCNLANSDWIGQFKGAQFGESNLSGASFSGNPDLATWDYAWAWADALPIFREYIKVSDDEEHFEINVTKQVNFLFNILICDPSKRIKKELKSNSLLNEVSDKTDYEAQYDCDQLSIQAALKTYRDKNEELYEMFFNQRGFPYP